MELTFRKEELLAQIKQARDEHRAIFEEACENYRKAVLAELDGFIGKVKKGERPRIVSALPMPEEHTADYDRVLNMLAACVEDEIKLDEHTYRIYVLGDWDWRMSFLSNTMSYTSRT